MRAIVPLLLIAMLCACASRPRGDVRFDEYYDFANAKKLAFAPDPPTRAEAPENVRAARAMARGDIERALAAKGFSFVSDIEQADLVVGYTLGTFAKPRLSGRSSWGTLAGMEIDFIDPQPHDMVWSGWAALTWRESSMDVKQEIARVVAFILQDFPPER